MLLALLLSVGELVGGQVYLARANAGGAEVAVWRYVAAGARKGPPVLLLPELGMGRQLFDHNGAGLARTLQAAGREVFVLEWRGTGRSSPSVRGLGGLDSLFDGDAHAALRLAREASSDGRVQLVGVGLGGAAAYLLAAEPGARVAAVVAFSVPAVYEVPNEAVRGVLAAARASGKEPSAAIDLRAYSHLPAPVGKGERDLFQLLFEYGDKLPGGRAESLRAALGTAAPELLDDVVRWMEQGDLPRGPRIRDALAILTAPLLVIAAPRDNLVHLEHALAVRKLAPRAAQEEIVLSRIEGFPEDAGHLALAAEWAAKDLHPRIAAWLAAHY